MKLIFEPKETRDVKFQYIHCLHGIMYIAHIYSGDWIILHSFQT